MSIFQDGTTDARTKIDMINICLEAIGEVPLVEGTDLNTLQIGTDADIAKRIVERMMVRIQKEGWYFNIDYDFKLIPDTNKFITMPPNTLKVDFGATEFDNNYVMKDKRIYDTIKQTYIIEQPIVGDITWLIDYTVLENEAFDYIASVAARRFARVTINSDSLNRELKIEEAEYKIEIVRAQLSNITYNMKDKRVSSRIHSGYLQPALYGTKGRR